MKMPHNLGMLLLAIWLIAIGAIEIFSGGSIVINIRFLLDVLAIVAGVLLLLGK